MSEIVTFVPASGLDARMRLESFVSLCRDEITVFGRDLDFDSDRWDISEAIRLRGKTGRVRIVFSSLGTCAGKNPAMMCEPFKSFAKSYLRYQHGMRPAVSFGTRVAALRGLEAALLETGDAEVVRVDALILNRAAQILAARGRQTVAYRVAGQLEMIADFLRVHRLTAAPTAWRHPVKRPVDSSRVGKEADERRLKKMPSQAALDALPAIYKIATIPADVLVSSTTAILCSAPDRISEVLELPVNCEVLSDALGDPPAYGLRWRPAKGADPMVKWVVQSMVTVLKGAISRIRSLTSEARAVAKWYETNPSMMFLGDDHQHFRGETWLSLPDVADILFAEPVKVGVATAWCQRNGIQVVGSYSSRRVKFQDVEKAVVSLLPKGFPVLDRTSGLRYSEALFVTQKNALHEGRARFRCIVERVNQGHIHNRLGARSTSGIVSIFDRAGFFEPDGSSIYVTTHQFRHYLNTLAHAGGMSQLDIAKWSGRRDISQNANYDHETSSAVVARIRAAIGDSARMFGPLAASLRAASISRGEFSRLKVPTAHTTDFGYCIHDYVMSPCQLHRDCLNCTEQICVKGDTLKEGNLRRAFEEGRQLLQMAEKVVADNEFGAAKWTEHHRLQVARIQSLLQLIDDATVPVGTFIQLQPTEAAGRLDQAVRQRLRLDGSVEVCPDVVKEAT